MKKGPFNPKPESGWFHIHHGGTGQMKIKPLNGRVREGVITVEEAKGMKTALEMDEYMY